MEKKVYTLKELLGTNTVDTEALCDKEGAVYLGQLLDMFPEDTEIEFDEDGKMSKTNKALVIVDKSIDYIDDGMIKMWDDENMNLRKIIEDKQKYLDMFADILEKCRASLQNK